MEILSGSYPSEIWEKSSYATADYVHVLRAGVEFQVELVPTKRYTEFFVDRYSFNEISEVVSNSNSQS